MRTWFVGIASLIGGSAFAQDVDITVVALNSDTLEVRLRPEFDFNALVSGLVFTLRWDTAGDVHVADPDQFSYGPPFCTFMSIPLGASPDGEIDANGYRYQTYGAVPLTGIPAGCEWVANVEVPLVRIPVVSAGGCTNFQIVNDGFTAANNKDYYISVIGLDTTGTIYGLGAPDMGDCSTAIAPIDEDDVALSPNPATDALHIALGEGTFQQWTIRDMQGKVVLEGRPQQGARTCTIALGTLPAGSYTVQVRSERGLHQGHFARVR